MTHNRTPVEPVSQRRSLRRWFVRAGLLLILFLVMGYVSLPWWFPAGYVAGRLGDELSATLNRQVHVGRLSLGWRSGVVIEDLTIANTHGDGKLAEVGRIRCGLTPLATLVTGRVDRIAIINPQLWVEIDDRGRTNLEDLNLPTDGGLLSLEYQLTEAVCHVITPEVSQRFQIDRLLCTLDEAAGTMQLVGGTGFQHRASEDAEARNGRLSVDVQLTVPQLNRSLDLKLGGQGSVVWTDLALNDLPIPIAARLPIEQVDGVSNGQATFHAYPGLDVDFDVTVGMKGVRIRHNRLNRTNRIPDADLQCVGQWDPNTDRLSVTAVTYESRALHLKPPTQDSASPMFQIDPQGEVPLQVRVAGEIKDWAALRSEFPRLDAWLESAGVTLTGQAEVEFEFTQTLGQDNLTLNVDAGASSCRVAGPEGGVYLDAPTGIEKGIHVDLIVDRDEQQPSVLHCQIDLGHTHLTTDALTLAPLTDAMSVLRSSLRAMPDLTSYVELEADRLDELVRLSPWLADRYRIGETSGSLKLKVRVDSDPDESKVQADLSFPAEASLHVADVIRKPIGQPLEVSLQMTVPHLASGRIEEPQLTVAHGDARLAIGGASAFVDYEWNDGESDDGENEMLSFAYRLPVDVADVDSLLTLLPSGTAIQDGHDIGELSGSARAEFAGDGQWARGAWTLRYEFNLDADALVGRWGEYFDKRSDVPLHVGLHHQLTSVDGRLVHHWEARVRSKGEIRVNTFASGAKAQPSEPSTRGLTVEARLDDIGHWLSFSPAAADALEPYSPQGAVTFRGRATQSSDGRFVSLHVDATRSSFDWPEAVSARRKPPGEPAVLKAQLSGTRDSTDAVQWQLAVDAFRLGGFAIKELTGSFVTPREITTPIELVRAAQEMDVTASGQVLLDELLPYVPAETLPRCVSSELTGSLDWRAHCVVRDEQVALTGWIDAVEAEWSCSLGDTAISEVRKAGSLPLLLAFDLGVPLDRDGPWRIDVRRLTLDLAGNTLQVSGSVESPAETGESAIDLRTEIDVTNGGAVSLLWPNGLVDRVEGQLTASAHVKGTWRAPTLTSGDVRFEEMGLDFGTELVVLDGQIAFDESHIDLDAFRVGWGVSTGVISGHIERAADAYTGRIGLVVDRFDAVELDQLIKQLTPSAARGRNPSATSDEIRKSLPETQEAALVRHDRATASAPTAIGADRSRERLMSLLNRCQLQVDVETKTGRVVLPPAVVVDADCFSVDIQLNRGPVLISFAGLVDGGYVHGTVDTRTDVDEPVYFLQYAAERIWPGPVVDAFLKIGFPGLKATGPLSLTDESYQKIFANSGEFETGKGEFSIQGGSVEGRAAPRWVTNIFPELNLAKFEFSYMHSWFEKLASGRVRHQMIFQGQFYNVYMEGYSDRNGMCRYEVGIDFLADFDSQYWASSGQGRIPLFTKTGQISPDGTMLDERVNYEPPQRILDVLLVKNNPVVTAYHAVRQRVLGQE